MLVRPKVPRTQMVAHRRGGMAHPRTCTVLRGCGARDQGPWGRLARASRATHSRPAGAGAATLLLLRRRA
eukprot:10280142-Alexandrium_andersonii.AAC.1